MLDQTDLLILDILQHNARLPNKDIAALIGKSTSRVFERIRRLKQEGYIKNFVAVLNERKINRGFVVYALVTLQEHSRKMLASFENEVAGLDEVIEVYYMSGGCHFMLKVAVADMNGYSDFLVKQVSRISEVKTVKSFFVIRQSHQNRLKI